MPSLCHVFILEQSEVIQTLPTIFILQTKHIEYLKASESSAATITTRPLRKSDYPIYLIARYTYSEIPQREGFVSKFLLRPSARIYCLLKNFKNVNILPFEKFQPGINPEEVNIFPLSEMQFSSTTPLQNEELLLVQENTIALC